MNLKQLRDRRAEIVSKGEAVIAGYTNENRAATEDEAAQLLALKADKDAIDVQIAAAEAQADAERAFAVAPGANVSGGNQRAEDDPTRGFATFGHFAKAVHEAATGGARDDRLTIGAGPTGANESVGADGGFLIPPQYSSRIHELSLEEDAILPMTDNDPISGNSMTFPADETTPWGSTGVRAYWEGEGQQGTETKPVVEPRSMRLHKLFALVRMTDELLEDAPAVSGYIERKASESIRWKTNDAFMNGTGAGTPEGVLLSPSLIAQAKESGQTADTIVAPNVVKMFSRCLNPARAFWMVNPDAFPQIPLMTLGNQPIFVAPGNLANAPAGTLLGRPIWLTDTCQTVGDQGDIVLADWNGYKTITKRGGIQTATSMHLWFDRGEHAFRATFRVDGEPWLRAPVDPPNSTSTRSCFVTLAART